MSNQKKAKQLGMNPSTASGRLVKDTLFRLAVDAGYKCFQCGEDLTRETFSIEHKEPWLDSANPLGNYFDQDNIAFSHLSCNVRESRGNTGKTHTCGTTTNYRYGCRCLLCKNANTKSVYQRPSRINRK